MTLAVGKSSAEGGRRPGFRFQPDHYNRPRVNGVIFLCRVVELASMLPGIKLFDLSERVAVITGGSKGLGLAMAEGLASAGADLVLVSRNEEEAKAAAKQVAEDFGTHAIGIRADVTVEAEMQQLAAQVADEFGRIDILVNNAGVNFRGPIEEVSVEDFRRVQQINVEGVWLATRAIVPQMKRQQHGRIINLASALGVVGMPDRTPYCSAKGAVVQMTRALASELAPFNITANAILPGPFLTAMNVPVKDDPQFRQFILGATVLGRWGELHEIQGAAIYLASDASSYVTGSMLSVDGGWTSH